MLEVNYIFKKQVLELIRSATKQFGGVKNLADIGCHSMGLDSYADKCYEAMKELYKEGYITRTSLVHNRKTASVDGHKYIEYGKEYTELKEIVQVTALGFNYEYGTVPQQNTDMIRLVNEMRNTTNEMKNTTGVMGRLSRIMGRATNGMNRATKSMNEATREMQIIKQGVHSSFNGLDSERIRYIENAIGKFDQARQRQIAQVIQQNELILQELVRERASTKNEKEFKERIKKAGYDLSISVACDLVKVLMKACGIPLP